MNWISLVIVSALFYGGYNFLLKLSSGHIHQILGAVILQGSALVVGLSLLFYLRSGGDSLNYSSTGIAFAVSAGVCVGVGGIIAFYIFSRGVPAGVGIPIIVGGTVAAGTMYGLFFLRESLTVLQWAGVLTVVSGIVLLTAKGTNNAVEHVTTGERTSRQLSVLAVRSFRTQLYPKYFILLGDYFEKND